MATDLKDTFSTGTDCIKIVGYDMTKLAANKAFKKANIKPSDVQVVELHDCFSANELITYEALGLCEIGKAADLVLKKDNTYGGKYVINPSGGLISKGHPLGKHFFQYLYNSLLFKFTVIIFKRCNWNCSMC